MIELATFLGANVGRSLILQYPQFLRQTLPTLQLTMVVSSSICLFIHPVDLHLFRAVCQALLDTSRTVKSISSYEGWEQMTMKVTNCQS